jgi:hypothetical protein
MTDQFPHAGGTYVRDPVTGAISPAPDVSTPLPPVVAVGAPTAEPETPPAPPVQPKEGTKK